MLRRVAYPVGIGTGLFLSAVVLTIEFGTRRLLDLLDEASDVFEDE